jgi:hypothetical protein
MDVGWKFRNELMHNFLFPRKPVFALKVFELAG